jgi:ribonucleoside-diphosphate reductase alpha chain
MDAFATSISLALQYGVPLKALIDKFSHMRFEPAGFTNNKEIPIAKSVMDYIFRWLASKFLDQEDRARVGVVEPERSELDAQRASADAGTAPVDTMGQQPLLPGLLPLRASSTHGGGARAGNGHVTAIAEERFPFRLQEDAPSCAECGALMIRNGACYKCLNCGATSGCS